MTTNGENLTPGEMLAAARSKAELSLEQLAEDTKIPANMLLAIEMDEYHKVSGDLYVKSFLRSYAEEVGLDPEEMIDAYHVFTGSAVDALDAAASGAWDERDVEIKRVGLPWGLITTAALVLVVGGGAFFWFSGRESDDGALENEVVEKQDTGHAESSNTTELPGVELSAIGDQNAEKTLPDTLALGWQMSAPAVIETPPPVIETPPSGTGKSHLPQAFAGTSQVIFEEGKKWPYVIRLISERPGRFEVMKDAEKKFTAADFPSSLAQAQPLPAENLVAGRAYAVQRGYVVYWGADDHLSLRLGHILGVELSFNAKAQDLARFNPGQEILLDMSLLNNGEGN